MPSLPRRTFLHHAGVGVAATALGSHAVSLLAQPPGDRPTHASDVTVINPRGRVPAGLIIDPTTCLVELTRFAMPQFDQASSSANKVYQRNWRESPMEIPHWFVS